MIYYIQDIVKTREKEEKRNAQMEKYFSNTCSKRNIKVV